jgi:NADPH:quinone reductase-like Zn-dependent oxidoreductase
MERGLSAPSTGEVRVRILAVPVCLPDVEPRCRRTPFAVKTPFVPDYAIVGVVNAIGDGVTKFTVGDRVTTLPATSFW